MDYTITTSELDEAALTAFVARENANAPSAGQPPWPSNQAYVTAAAQRLLFDPLRSLLVEGYVATLGAGARQATLAELEAAAAALPDV